MMSHTYLMCVLTELLDFYHVVASSAEYTVGGSRRNPNLQLQGEPVIPKKNLCPWNNSSIAPALCKKTLEIDNNPEPGAPVEKMASGSPPLLGC